MREVIQEQEAKRKSELDSLQAQITPHFLYNTLDIVVWMIEENRKRRCRRHGYGTGKISAYQPQQRKKYHHGSR
ncbi:MAG: sensor histidine kinase [Hominisplanchenecus sp.]